jgi:hypothetical protein
MDFHRTVSLSGAGLGTRCPTVNSPLDGEGSSDIVEAVDMQRFHGLCAVASGQAECEERDWAQGDAEHGMKFSPVLTQARHGFPLIVRRELS